MITETATVNDIRITFETGQIARNAQGAVVVREGQTMILATVVTADDPSPDPGYLPLTVEYRERMAAAGRVPGNYFRRESRMGDHEVLASRLIDRMIRPCFSKTFRRETQVSVTVFSAETSSDLVGLALLAAGAAIHLAALPFSGPVGGLTVRAQRGQVHTFAAPSRERECEAELVVAAGREGLIMFEGEADRIADERLLELLDAASGALIGVWDAMDRLRAAAGRAPDAVETEPEDATETALGEEAVAQVTRALCATDKTARRAALAAIIAAEGDDASRPRTEAEVTRLARSLGRNQSLEGRRLDGRGATEIRPISCETGTLPSNHGSALFTRGRTQALVSVTLGGQRDAVDQETLEGVTRHRVMLHYNFPGYAVGEVRPNRGTGRRELGHGYLALRALTAVLPPASDCPYTIRVVSDITESDGSSSMATVCGATLALLSAGVALAEPVAGIALGLVTEGDRHVILSDILGEEDALGDMDLKVAGTAEAITAIQLDNKLGQLPRAVLVEALTQARAGRQHVLSEMRATLAALPDAPPPHVPRHARVQVNPARLGQLIGPGGQNLNQIQGKTGARIEVANDNSGNVLILAPNEGALRRAVRSVQSVSIVLSEGGTYQAQIKSVRDDGVWVQIADNEGLVPASELTGAFKPGQQMIVRVLGADPSGRLRLSPSDRTVEALNA